MAGKLYVVISVVHKRQVSKLRQGEPRIQDGDTKIATLTSTKVNTQEQVEKFRRKVSELPIVLVNEYQ